MSVYTYDELQAAAARRKARRRAANDDGPPHVDEPPPDVAARLDEEDGPAAAPKRRRAPRTPAPGDFERGDHVELAARMLAELGPRDDLIADEGAAFRYDATRGLFVELERGEQSRILQGFAGTPAGEKGKPLAVSAGDVTGAIRLAYDQIERPGFFADGPPGLAFANGFVRVSPGSVERGPHSPENRARAGYAFPFDATKTAPGWLRFLHDVFATDADRLERIAFLREWLGAALLGLVPRWELAIVLVGTGANGKSTFIRIVSSVMPKGSTVAIAPQLWGNEYRLAAMRGARLNIVSELPTGDILASETFKAIITGDPVDARPIREAPFTLRPIAGHLFAANTLPGTRDLTEGFWRRLVVLRFSQHFPRETADAGLADRVLAEETPAIVAWMLGGAADLLARGRFVVPSSSQREVEAWKRKADAVAMFVAEECADAKGDARGAGDRRVTCGDFYERFRRWAEKNGFIAPSARTVGERMVALGKASAKSDGRRLYPVRWLDPHETADADEDQAASPARGEEGPSWD